MSNQLLLGLALVVGAPALKPAPKAPSTPTLVGEWKFEVMVADGRPEPCPGQTVTFAADGTFVGAENGQAQGAGTYTSNLKADPPEVDVSEAGVGGPLKGIWRLDGDTLTLCLSQDPKLGRPQAFAAPAGSGFVLVKLRRVKKAD